MTIILIFITICFMYICLCNAVSEQEVITALDKGARNLHDLQNRLNLGTQCGACRGCARDLIIRHHHRNATTSSQACETGMLPASA